MFFCDECCSPGSCLVASGTCEVAGMRRYVRCRRMRLAATASSCRSLFAGLVKETNGRRRLLYVSRIGRRRWAGAGESVHRFRWFSPVRPSDGGPAPSNEGGAVIGSNLMRHRRNFLQRVSRHIGRLSP